MHQIYNNNNCLSQVDFLTLELVLLKVQPCESLNFHQSVAELNLFDVCAHAFSSQTSPATLFLFLSVSKIQSGGVLSDPRMH